MESERPLIDKLRNGDRCAFGQLVDKHWDKIFNRANSLLSNREDAEEVAQDTFVRAKRSLANFRGECSLSTWLYHIATNLARNKHWYWWRRKRSASISLDTPVGEDGTLTIADVLASDAVNPADENASEEFMRLLPQAIKSLPQKYGEVLRLRNEEDLSYDDISKRMGISVGTVKSRLSRAREYLRNEMERFK